MFTSKFPRHKNTNWVQQITSLINEYKLTDDGDFLLEAIDIFNKNRAEFIESLQLPIVVVNGWISKNFREVLFEQVFGKRHAQPYRVRYFPRPDLKSFLKGWRAAGFNLTIEGLQKSSKLLDQNIFASAGPIAFESQVVGHIDKVGFNFRGNILNDATETNIRCLVSVIEATIDSECAKLLLESGIILTEDLQIILELVSGTSTDSFQVGKWQKVQIHTPTWIPLQESPNFFTQARPANAMGNIIPFVKSVTEVPAPIRKYAWIADAVVTHGGTVISGSSLIQNDPVQAPYRGFIAGRWDHVAGSHSALQNAYVKMIEPSLNINKAILLSGRADMNWFHWVFEYLPRIFQLEGVIPEDIPLLVSKTTVPAGIELLSLITHRKIIFTERDKGVFVEDLLIPGPCLYHPDSTNIPWEKGTSLDFQAIDKLKDSISLHFGKKKPPTNKIYWRRDSTHRNIVNQDEIIEFLTERDFQIIQPEGLSLAEQYEIFNSAEIVISAMGAMTPNFLFMQETASVISLTADSSSDYILPGVIASRYISNYVTVVGEQKASGTEINKLDYFHNDFAIDLADLQRALDISILSYKASEKRL